MPDRGYSRTPDTRAMLIGCVLSGAVLAVTRTVPTSVEGIVPWWVGLIWALLFTASATASLVGLYHRDQIDAWFLELGGRIVLAGCAGMYTLALVTTATSIGSAVIVALAGAVTFGSAGRAWQVWKRLDQTRAALRRKVKR